MIIGYLIDYKILRLKFKLEVGNYNKINGFLFNGNFSH